MARQRKRPRAVREPLQIYLDQAERALLDRLARETRLSRAEILRRGLRSFAAENMKGRSPLFEFLKSMAGDDWPADIATRHDDYLAEAYLDNHEESG